MPSQALGGTFRNYGPPGDLFTGRYLLCSINKASIFLFEHLVLPLFTMHGVHQRPRLRQQRVAEVP
jgi:hypothetical protein